MRVSTASKSRETDRATFVRNPQVQGQPLREIITQRIVSGLFDRASGVVEKRTGLDALMADARRGLFDAVILRRFGRFVRSVKQFVLGLEEFRAPGIDFVSHQETLDTSTPMGKAMFTIIAARAELERNIIGERLICERVPAGVEHAR